MKKIDIIPQTNEQYISVTYGCTRFFDSSRILSSSLDSLVKTLVDIKHKISEVIILLKPIALEGMIYEKLLRK